MHFQLKLKQIKRSDEALRWGPGDKDYGRNSTGMWRQGGVWQEEKRRGTQGTLLKNYKMQEN